MVAEPLPSSQCTDDPPAWGLAACRHGDTLTLRFPPGWSGNAFATKAGWVSSQAGRQVKWGGASHSVLLEYTFGCSTCGNRKRHGHRSSTALLPAAPSLTKEA